MVQRQGGSRRKTRSKLRKQKRQKGKISHARFLQQLENGQKVKLVAEPAYQKGMYMPKYHGMVGVVKSKSGKCYNISIKDHDKEKTLIVHPVHLKKV